MCLLVETTFTNIDKLDDCDISALWLWCLMVVMVINKTFTKSHTTMTTHVSGDGGYSLARNNTSTRMRIGLPSVKGPL